VEGSERIYNDNGNGPFRYDDFSSSRVPMR